MLVDGLPGANVFLSVDDAALHEHETESHSSEHAVNALAYVEAVAGAAFAVNINLDYAFKYRKDDLIIEVYVDGARIKSNVVARGTRYAKIDKVHVTSSTIRRFMFAEHQTSMRRCQGHRSASLTLNRSRR
jgi:hypothetical protein